MIHAAVFIAIVRSEKPQMVFVERVWRPLRTPEQLAFPFELAEARREAEEAAALRAFERAVGVAQTRARIIAALDPVELPELGLSVAPFVASAEPPVHERVGELESVPLRVYTVDLNDVHENAIDLAFAPDDVTRCSDWGIEREGLRITGASARILERFLVRFPRKTRGAFT